MRGNANLGLVIKLALGTIAVITVLGWSGVSLKEYIDDIHVTETEREIDVAKLELEKLKEARELAEIKKAAALAEIKSDLRAIRIERKDAEDQAAYYHRAREHYTAPDLRGMPKVLDGEQAYRLGQARELSAEYSAKALGYRSTEEELEEELTDLATKQ